MIGFRRLGGILRRRVLPDFADDDLHGASGGDGQQCRHEGTEDSPIQLPMDAPIRMASSTSRG